VAAAKELLAAGGSGTLYLDVKQGRVIGLRGSVDD
jgi:hypothetical protein